jgi:hypothetical protein
VLEVCVPATPLNPNNLGLDVAVTFKLPLPKILLPLIVLIFVPLTNVFCFPEIESIESVSYFSKTIVPLFAK